jgi:hypothetical protein
MRQLPVSPSLLQTPARMLTGAGPFPARSSRRELALREHVLHLPPSITAPAAEDELSHNAGDATSGFGHQATITAGHTQTTIYTPPPILDPKSTCSGYFIEPMGWMDPLFDGSTVAGKLTCPNTRCKAKLGNFDWAGQKCGCKAWITPGFCLTRGKVDGRSPFLLTHARGNEALEN